MRILLVVSRYPWPPRRGDQLRTEQTLRALAPAHEIILLAPEPGPDAGPPPRELAGRFDLATYRPNRWVGSVLGVLRAALVGKPLQCGLYESADLRRQIRRHLATSELLILQLVRLAGAAPPGSASGVPILVDLIDSLSLNFFRRAALDRPWLRPLLTLEAKRLQMAERRLAARARRTVLVSPRDLHWLQERGGLDPEGARRLEVVRLAMESQPMERQPMDCQPGAMADVAQGDSRPTVALTGNLGYFVNVDAVLWWLSEVWPELSRRRPEVRLVVAGARPTRRVERKVKEAGGELVASPPDLRAIMARAMVAVAPLRGGSGVPVKVLEAWSLGVPTVVSPWAAAGTDGIDGEDFLVADTPESWIAAVLRSIDHPELRQRLGAAGRRRLAEDHSVERVDQAWREVVASAARS